MLPALMARSAQRTCANVIQCTTFLQSAQQFLLTILCRAVVATNCLFNQVLTRCSLRTVQLTSALFVLAPEMSLARRQTLNVLRLLSRHSQNTSSQPKLAAGCVASLRQACGVGDQQQQQSSGVGLSWQLPRQITQHSGVQGLLDSMQAVKLRDALDVAADKQPFMSYRELLDFIIKNGAADTEEEAHARADALVYAGVVLRFNGIVYLKPQEVSELVYRTLPTDPAQARRNLVAIEQELSQMDLEHKQLRSTAKRWPRFWLWTGFAALSFQLTAFIYLTYWELSWDVMEPIGYMLSLTYSLLAYFYFLVTRGNYFDYGPFEEYWTQQQLEKRMAEKGFDPERYTHLMRTRERYKRYLAAQEEASGTEADATSAQRALLSSKATTS
ncbi:hypothetical protein COO60DRAFT_291374 [Scenedesmus sp. NREL 46B-D3]|nr:hypothetical protein COO60DRAFT_291374 [Scenedesmus sp. NREL 46B-D3]